MKEIKTIEDVQQEVESALQWLSAWEQTPEQLQPLRQYLSPRPGEYPRVRLVDKNKRKRRKDANAGNWNRETDLISIYFEQKENSPPRRKPANFVPHEPISPLAELVKALDEAQRTPGYDFVSLKWFRDTFLPATKYTWAGSEPQRMSTIKDAIEKRLILTSKVPNPKAPAFPVTGIQINRSHPDVQAIYGDLSAKRSNFEPVQIAGERLSHTILQARR